MKKLNLGKLVTLFIIVLFGFSMVAGLFEIQLVNALPLTFGYQSATTLEGKNGNYLDMANFTVATPFVTSNLSLDVVATGNSLEAVIYFQNGTLIGVGSPVSSYSTGWVNLPFLSSLAEPAGTYWIGAYSNNTFVNNQLYWDHLNDSIPNNAVWSGSSGAAPVSLLSGGTVYVNSSLNVLCNYIVGNGVNYGVINASNVSPGYSVTLSCNLSSINGYSPSTYLFSWNNSGSWVNQTVQTWTSNPAIFTGTWNNTLCYTVGVQIFANSTDGTPDYSQITYFTIGMQVNFANTAATAYVMTPSITGVSMNFLLTSGTFALTNVTAYLARVGSPTGTNAYIGIFNTTGTAGTNATPTGTPLATTNPIDISTFSTTPTLLFFSFNSSIILINDTQYAVAFLYGSGVSYDSSNYVTYTCQGSQVYSNADLSRLNGGTWDTSVATSRSWYVQLFGTLPVPTFSNITVSSTTAGASSTLTCYWQDNTTLSFYIFSTNNTKTWLNSTATAFSTTPSWANQTLTLDSTPNDVVGCIWYANNSIGNWNNTGVQTLTITAPTPTPTPTPSPGGGGIILSPTPTPTTSGVTFQVSNVDLGDVAINQTVQATLTVTYSGSAMTVTNIALSSPFDQWLVPGSIQTQTTPNSGTTQIQFTFLVPSNDIGSFQGTVTVSAKDVFGVTHTAVATIKANVEISSSFDYSAWIRSHLLIVGLLLAGVFAVLTIIAAFSRRKAF